MTLVAAQLVRRHARFSAALSLVGFLGALILFYLVFIRPFSAGFDLVSVREGNGVAASTLINQAGQELENQLSGLRALSLNSEEAGNLTRLDRLEQVVGESQPMIFGLSVSGRQDQALLVGLGRPSDGPHTYIIEDGFNFQGLDQGLLTDGLEVDEVSGRIQTQGPTRLEDRGTILRAENGVIAVEGGNLEIR